MTSFYLFEAVGGMDEAYQAECQDVALCLSLDRIGFYSLIVFTGNVIHIENGTRDKGEECWKDRRRFLRKWGSYIESRFL